MSHYPRYFDNNRKLYSQQLIKKFNLAIKVNAKEIIKLDYKNFYKKLKNLKNLELKNSIKDLCQDKRI